MFCHGTACCCVLLLSFLMGCWGRCWWRCGPWVWAVLALVLTRRQQRAMRHLKPSHHHTRPHSLEGLTFRRPAPSVSSQASVQVASHSTMASQPCTHRLDPGRHGRMPRSAYPETCPPSLPSPEDGKERKKPPTHVQDAPVFPAAVQGRVCFTPGLTSPPSSLFINRSPACFPSLPHPGSCARGNCVFACSVSMLPSPPPSYLPACSSLSLAARLSIIPVATSAA